MRNYAIAGALAVSLTAGAQPANATGVAPLRAHAAGERCYGARVSRRQSRYGVHQWTVRMAVRWCGRPYAHRVGWYITRKSGACKVTTGTNWRLISKRFRIRLRAKWHGRYTLGTAVCRAHVRLSYPFFEQNAYPENGMRFRGDGWRRKWRDKGF